LLLACRRRCKLWLLNIRQAQRSQLMHSQLPQVKPLYNAIAQFAFDLSSIGKQLLPRGSLVLLSMATCQFQQLHVHRFLHSVLGPLVMVRPKPTLQIRRHPWTDSQVHQYVHLHAMMFKHSVSGHHHCHHRSADCCLLMSLYVELAASLDYLAIVHVG